VDNLASKEDFFFSLQAYYAKHYGVLLRKHCKEGAYVVTHFLAPRAGDGVYLFEPNARV
jgi:hypothetical protein